MCSSDLLGKIKWLRKIIRGIKKDIQTCPVCGMGLLEGENQDHLKTYHPNKCAYCSKYFSSKHSIKKHLKSKHPHQFSPRP